MAHFVYMLKCAGDRIYTGYAVDVEARYGQHVSGKGARFTRAFPPECILRTFQLDSKEKALRLEARIKKLDRKRKELLAGSSSTSGGGCGSLSPADALLERLMESLSETLPQKKSRLRRKKRARKIVATA